MDRGFVYVSSVKLPNWPILHAHAHIHTEKLTKRDQNYQMKSIYYGLVSIDLSNFIAKSQQITSLIQIYHSYTLISYLLIDFFFFLKTDIESIDHRYLLPILLDLF